MNLVQKIALSITMIGGITWALIGLFSFNIIAFIFQDGSFFTRTIYILFGVCALTNLSLLVLPQTSTRRY